MSIWNKLFGGKRQQSAKRSQPITKAPAVSPAPPTKTITKPPPPSDQDTINAAKNGNTADVQALLGKGANPNAKESDGWTALMWAAARGQLEVVLLLLENGAEIDAKDNDGYTALMHACLRSQAKVSADFARRRGRRQRQS